MLPKQEVAAMLLTSGQGSRLGVLTKNLAKLAVPCGGKYRTIDSPLSSYVNPGIEAVGVPTQYQPLVLNDYIGSGQPWDPDSMDAGVHMLVPYQRGHKADQYKGTANAIYQNTPFIERYYLDYVVILSSDHIYRMDYSKMIAYHKERGTDHIIAQIEAPWGEVPRFGILNARENGSIYEFDEKPRKPKSNKVSMGIYVFSWSKLRKCLEQGETGSKSSNNFGKDLPLATSEAGKRMFAYEFDGYWKNAGTIKSLWKLNMDLLDPHAELDLGEPSRKIYSRNPAISPHYPAPEATVQNLLIAESCNVYGKADFIMLSASTYVVSGAVVRDSIVMPGNRAEEGAIVQYTVVSENATIGKDAVVGVWPEEADDKLRWGVAVISENCVIAPDAVVSVKAIIDAKEVTR